jgi:hypothetical protein
METNVQYRVHNSPSTVPTLCQMNPVHAPKILYLLRSILSLQSYVRLNLPSGLFSSSFQTKIL